MLPLTLLGLVVMVTPILPESLLNSSAFLLVPTGSCRAGSKGMSMLSFELSESAALKAEVSPPAAVTGDSRPSIELARVSSSTVSRLLLFVTDTENGASVAESSWLSSPIRSSPPGSSSTTRLASTCSCIDHDYKMLFSPSYHSIIFIMIYMMSSKLLKNFRDNLHYILCPFALAV